MPASHVHFNGGVNLPDAETVMREIARRVPQGLRRIPDGETGDRRQWVFFQAPKFAATRGLEREAATTVNDANYFSGFSDMRIAEGVDPADLGWPDLGYADAYAESFQTFRKLKQQHVIPAGARFQAEYPTPFAVTTNFVVPGHQSRVEDSYAQALFADLDRLLATVPHDEIAIQWDVAYEVALLTGGLPAISRTFDAVMEHLARCLDRIPDDVPAGVHLCYGDSGHRHFVEPDSLDLQARMANAIWDKTRRGVSWIAFTIPQYQSDPAYFASLKNLRLPHDTELNFALVPYYPDRQPPETTAAQARLVENNLAAREDGHGALEWGICTDCGMARIQREGVPQLLDLHRQILAEYGQQEPGR
jgi:hypothetical protein